MDGGNVPLTGVPGENGKDYIAKYEGHHFRFHRLSPSTSLFQCEGKTGTVGELKKHVKALVLAEKIDSETADSLEVGTPVDPCAWLCELLYSFNLTDYRNFPAMMRTLEDRGWTAEDGTIDIDRAKKHIALHTRGNLSRR